MKFKIKIKKEKEKHVKKDGKIEEVIIYNTQ
jgi:hypothetical protein